MFHIDGRRKQQWQWRPAVLFSRRSKVMEQCNIQDCQENKRPETPRIVPPVSAKRQSASFNINNVHSKIQYPIVASFFQPSFLKSYFPLCVLCLISRTVRNPLPQKNLCSEEFDQSNAKLLSLPRKPTMTRAIRGHANSKKPNAKLKSENNYSNIQYGHKVHRFPKEFNHI